MSTFEKWWNTEGIRLLGDNNAIPTLEDRCRAAYNAGKQDQLENFDLPPDAYIAAIEMEDDPE